ERRFCANQRRSAETPLRQSRHGSKIFCFPHLPDWCLVKASMLKTALLFAGQGAQYVGMGRDLAERCPGVKTWFDRANTTLGYDLATICLEGPEAELTRTENAQP